MATDGFEMRRAVGQSIRGNVEGKILYRNWDVWFKCCSLLQNKLFVLKHKDSTVALVW